MAWVGSTFVRNNSAFTGPTVWTEDRDAGTKITAAHHDYHDQDIADGITLCLRNDGGNPVTGNVNWGGNIITNYGTPVASSDVARYGGIIASAALDAMTNILTLTKVDGTTVTVDLTALVIGGSTADFPRLSADNEFAGINTFDQAVVSAAGLSIPKTGGNVALWRVAADAFKWTVIFSGTYTGTAVSFLATGNNAGTLSVCGQPVALQADIASFLSTTSNPAITGSWNFSGGSIILPAGTTFGAAGGAWQTNITTSVFQLFAVSSSALLKVDYDATEGTRIFADARRVWTNGNDRNLTAAPTGGVSGDRAWVTSGADRGLWYNDGGVWSKLVPFT